MWKDSETRIDYLNFDYLVDIVSDLVSDKDITPSTIGIYGDWGSGKSSLMAMVEEKVSKKPKVLCVRFNGWLFEGYEDAKTALCGTIIEKISEKKRLPGKAKDLVHKLQEKIDGKQLLGRGIKYGLDLLLTGGIGTLTDITVNGILDKIKEKTISISKDDILSIIKQNNETNKKRAEIKEFQTDFANLIKESKIEHLVVFIDELDRCEPETILELFAAIRLFLFAEGSSFVIGADERLIQYAIKTKYSEIPGNNLDIGKEYLEKLIQYPINIPQLNAEEVEQYISCLLLEKALKEDEIKEEDFETLLGHIREIKPTEKLDIQYLKEKAPRLFEIDKVKESFDLSHQVSVALASRINGNPRQCKRFLNTLAMRLKMAKSRNVTLKLNVAAKLLLLEYYKPQLYAIVVDPTNKEDLKQFENSEEIKDNNVYYSYKDQEWVKEWLKISVKIADENLGEYYYFSRKNLRINQFINSSLSPKATECYNLFKQGSDMERNKALTIAKELAPSELYDIHNKLFEDMNRSEKIDIDTLKSFVRLSCSSDELKSASVALLMTIPIAKYNTPVAAQLTELILSLESISQNELVTYLSQDKTLKTTIDGVLKYNLKKK